MSATLEPRAAVLAPSTAWRCDENDAQRKAFATLRARLAIAGYALSRTDPADGPPTYFASRWGLVRELPDARAVVDFAKQVGALE